MVNLQKIGVYALYAISAIVYTAGVYSLGQRNAVAGLVSIHQETMRASETQVQTALGANTLPENTPKGQKFLSLEEFTPQTIPVIFVYDGVVLGSNIRSGDCTTMVPSGLRPGEKIDVAVCWDYQYSAQMKVNVNRNGKKVNFEKYFDVDLINKGPIDITP